jgi:hypothetical protein
MPNKKLRKGKWGMPNPKGKSPFKAASNTRRNRDEPEGVSTKKKMKKKKFPMPK